MKYVTYESNNSGGHWWLKDEDWEALEKAGWKVVWENLEYIYGDKGERIRDEDGTPKLVPVGEGNSGYKPLCAKQYSNGDFRFLGALARTAYRPGLSMREAVDEWERITNGCSTDAGCSCCGQPHYFTEYDDEGKYVASGPNADYVIGW